MQIDMILHSIDQGQLALPEFQRGYVWNRDQVRALMDSLYKRHPVLMKLNDWVSSLGLPEGQFLFEIQDPETGDATAILDLAWPDGLQEGLSRPVTVLLDEGKDSPPPPSLPCRDQSPTQSVAQGSAEQRALVSLDQS